MSDDRQGGSDPSFEDLGAEARRLAEAASRFAQQASRFGQARGREFAGAARDAFDEGSDMAGRAVQKNPLLALAAATGMGLILGLARRR
ncbi:hypothetical protein [Psychromarinibacter halotolerans]|uniref:ElaB/YqjD/DUF883 family membrane-anchored ribosome-binding protein n=1 Tax=Psychromarinibacter halotolerans TaxID=1775175 RepID=A0ABV7GQF7_9RHOB|nr:hypothetical protein [Psychromarinibacter halotolerans]MDF0594918.1 hypothetical protein [Psychromarinibacter halotolerans]